MNKSLSFIRALFEELNEWVSLDIITPSQRERIAELYKEKRAVVEPLPKAVPKPESTSVQKKIDQIKEPINIARVVIGLASFCLAVGIVIFYASNWRKMPPIAKLIQVFLLIVTTNGAAFFFLSGKRALPMLGRALLIIGMICYGAGIMLVAQIYHISAHPANGVLAWGVGVIAMSALMRERYGYYLSTLLFFIWNCMEFFTYGNPMFVYIVPVLLIGTLLYRERDRIGTIASTLLFCWYFFQVSLYVIYHYAVPGVRSYIFIGVFILSGALMNLAGKYLSRDEFLKTSGKIISACGILAYLLPLVQITYLETSDTNYLLIWAISVFAVALLTRGKIALYFSVLLFFIWNISAIDGFTHANYWFLMPVVLIGFVSYRLKDKAGVIIASIFFGWYLIQLGAYIISTFTLAGYRGMIFIGACIIIGGVLKFSKQFVIRLQLLHEAGFILYACGWMLYLFPIAQLMHLNAPDSHGLLVLAIAVFVAECALRETIGLYAAAAAFLAWSFQEIYLYDVIPYTYAIPVLVIGFLFYRKKDDAGIAVSTLCAVYTILLVTFRLIGYTSGSESYTAGVAALMIFPIGAFFVVAGRACAHNGRLSSTRDILTMFGWIGFSIPFVVLSWPVKMKTIPHLVTFSGTIASSIEYLVLIALVGAVLYFLYRKKESLQIFGFVALCAAAVFFLPLSHTATRMVSLHIMIIALSGIVLFYSYTLAGNYARERAFGMIFTVTILAIKGIGFISYSIYDNGYKLAYLIGFILFAVVIFLVNRLVHHLAALRGNTFPVAILDALCAIFIWISVFISSFEVSHQKSIFAADRIVVIMIILFVSIAVLLYGFLLSRLREGRSIVYLSLVIFIASGITLFVAGPDVSWVVYSLVFNILLLLISIVCIYYSTIIQSKVVLNIAIAGFVLHVIVRYFDLFWDMLSGSLLFIATGLIGLIGGYFLERNRRILLDKMKSTPQKKSVTDEGESK